MLLSCDVPFSSMSIFSIIGLWKGRTSARGMLLLTWSNFFILRWLRYGLFRFVVPFSSFLIFSPEACNRCSLLSYLTLLSVILLLILLWKLYHLIIFRFSHLTRTFIHIYHINHWRSPRIIVMLFIWSIITFLSLCNRRVEFFVLIYLR